MGDSPPPVWRWPAFCAEFADPYMEGTDMEGGRIHIALHLFDNTLAALVGEDSENRALLTLLSESSFAAIDELREMIQPCGQLAAKQMQVEKPEQLAEITNDWMTAIEALPVGGMLFLPGGWTDGRGVCEANLMHIVERTSDAAFSFVTCNPGDMVESPETGREHKGILHHPSFVGHAPKIKYKTCLRLDEVPQERMSDPAFLAMLLNLRLPQKPDESHKPEMLYDALLPWLVGCPLMQVAQTTLDDPASEFRTPQRSRNSGYRCVLEAARYVLRRKGLTRQQLKQLTCALRMEMLAKVSTDLDELADPASRFRNAIELLGKGDVVDGSGARVGPEALRGKTVAVYFSAHWCPPCRQFTPVLAQLYETLRARTTDFEVVFVSADKSAEEFASYFRSMPWLALSFDKSGTKNALMQLLGVQGFPTLVLFGPDGNLLTKEGRGVVMNDPTGAAFPWHPEAAEDEGANNNPGRLRASDVHLIHVACQQAALSAVKENEAGRLTLEQMRACGRRARDVEALARSMPVDGAEQGGLPASVDIGWRMFENVPHITNLGFHDVRPFPPPPGHAHVTPALKETQSNHALPPSLRTGQAAAG